MITEEITDKDLVMLRQIIRFELAAVFYDLYRRKNMGKVKDTLKKIIKEEIKKSLNEEMTIYSKKDGIAKLNRMKKKLSEKFIKLQVEKLV